MTLATSQPCCFRFVFLRFICLLQFVVLGAAQIFILFPSLFLLFPCGKGATWKIANWWNLRRRPLCISKTGVLIPAGPCQPNVRIEKSVQRFPTLRQFVQIEYPHRVPASAIALSSASLKDQFAPKKGVWLSPVLVNLILPCVIVVGR